MNQPTVIQDSNFCGPVNANGECTQPNFGRRYFAQQPDMTALLPLDYAQLQMFYNAFQASLNKRFANGFNFLAAYTFAKNLGNADGNVGGFNRTPTTPTANTDPLPPTCGIASRLAISGRFLSVVGAAS